MTKKEQFITEFIKLCEKHNLAIQCEDPYCGLEIVPYEGEIKEYYTKNPGSFGRWHE